MPRILQRLSALFLALVLLVVAFSAPAFAHATLIGSEPADDAVVEQAPARLSLRFSEPVTPLVLRLVAPNGASTVVRAEEADGAVLTIAAPPAMARGTHALTYRIVSADGHPVGGTLLFSIGASSGAPGRAQGLDWPVTVFVFASRLLLYLGLFLGLGGLSYGLFVQPLAGTARGIVRGFLLTGLAAAPLALAAQGLDALEAPLGDVLRPAIWATGYETAFGRTVTIAILAFGLGLLALRCKDTRPGAILAGLALAGAGLALAAAGHAATAPPQWLTRPAVFLHGVTLAFWLGSLLPLGLALQSGSEAGRAALRRFSDRIAPALALLVASGALLAVVQVESVAALWTTAYGWVLLAKLALVGLLLLIAAANRWSLTAPVLGGADRGAGERMVGAIGMEVALVLLILALVGLWRFTPPPRALAEAAARPAVAHLTTGRLQADVTVTPGQAGPVTLTATLATIDYAPVDPAAASITFTAPEPGVAPIRRPAEKPGDGTLRATADLPSGGRWTIGIEIETRDAGRERVEGVIDIRP
ncbi:copper resistance protein C [Aureimonas endophytica]|uniref:Copper resistance protein C n=1 Tax=Aureimonas endophytica TaxID=2027858 RepID=A0A916ZFG2_9HYPH|nr:copper resistance protein CopC [Aureimonas endophytica]GGD94217.1 copper resistance protein C [Aureimonas endophytica]